MDEASVTRSPDPTHASVDSRAGSGERGVDAKDVGEESSASESAEVDRSVPQSLLSLHDAATETGLDGRHIQAWLEFEHEAMRRGVPVGIGRDDLEARVVASKVERDAR